MKLIFGLGLLLIGSDFRFALANDDDKVQLINASLYMVNPEYISKQSAKYEIITADDGRNRLHTTFNFLKDLPKKTLYYVHIHRSKSQNGPWELVDFYKSRLCNKKDSLREYLPRGVLAMSRGAGKDCLKKDHYETQDAGILKYDEILHRSETEGYYIRVTARLCTQPDGDALYVDNFLIVADISKPSDTSP